MAILGTSAVQELRTRLNGCSAPWLLAGYQLSAGEPPAKSLQGTLGFLDWRLHGRLARLVREARLPPGEIAMLSNRGRLGQATLLVAHLKGDKSDLTSIETALKGLQAQDICVAASSFPEDFVSKLEAVFTKAGIRWTTLEATQ